MTSTIPEVDADSVKRMIDSSRQSKASTVFDIRFSNVKNNVRVNEVSAEKKKSNTYYDADFGFLLNIFEFLSWP